MEIVEGGATKVDQMRGNRKHKKLNIDDYLHFIDDRTHDLTADQLREIIGMHGLKKIKVKKSTLIDVITTMDLMDLRRSTLPNGDVSGGASLTLEEVTKDLKNLDWQECHVTSLLTLGAVAPAGASASTAPVKRKNAKECHVTSDLLAGDAAVTAVPAKRKADKKCHVTSDLLTGDAAATAVPAKRKADKKCHVITSPTTTKGTVTPAVPAKRRRAKERLDYSSLHTEGTTEVAVEAKVAKKRKLSSILAECAAVPAAGGGGAVAVKRKRPKGLVMKPTKGAVDGRLVCYGTTVAAGSTSEG